LSPSKRSRDRASSSAFVAPARRELAVGFAALTVFALIAWWHTASSARGMWGMPGTMGMPLFAFLSMWNVMMIAMMLPATTPVVVLWGRMIASQSAGARRYGRLLVFLFAYLVAWALLGAATWLALRALESVVPRAWFANGTFAATALAIAGIYQLTPAKNWCLEHCRSPISLLAHFRGRDGPFVDFRIGFLHGGYCIGCCAGLMVVLMGVGLMNVPVMVVLTIVIFAEKLAPYSSVTARTTGVLLLCAAPVVLLWARA
jgi:predicted metal-binding membrane protein